MLHGKCGLAAVSLGVFTFTAGLSAGEQTPAAQTPQSVQTATTAPDVVPRADYLELKQEVERLKQHVVSQDKRLAATTQPAAPTAAPATTEQGRGNFSFPSMEADSHAFQTLFAARTEEEYFSPFKIMNPAHIKPDLDMQIGAFRDMNLYIGLETVGRYQAIQQQNVYISGAKQPGIDPGFQDPFANLQFLAQIPDKLDVYFDTYVASRPHASTMYGHEGYILFRQLPDPFNTGATSEIFNYVNVKLGAFDIDFGDGNYHRSNNAFVERNALIANPLVDPNVEEIGGEVYSVKGPIYWLFGVASGTTTEHFDYGGAQPSFHGKIWAYPLPNLRTSVSTYHVDLSESADTSYLFANGRSGGALAAVFGGGDSTPTSDGLRIRTLTAQRPERPPNAGSTAAPNRSITSPRPRMWRPATVSPRPRLSTALDRTGGSIGPRWAAGIGSPTTFSARLNTSTSNTTGSVRPTAW